MAGSGGSEDSDDLSHLARPVETEEPAAVLSPAPEHGKPFTAKGKGKRPEPYSGKSSHGPFVEKGKNSYPGKGKTPLLVPFGKGKQGKHKGDKGKGFAEQGFGPYVQPGPSEPTVVYVAPTPSQVASVTPAQLNHVVQQLQQLRDEHIALQELVQSLRAQITILQQRATSNFGASQQSRFCTNCGTPYAHGHRFCPGCGQLLA